MEYLCILNAFEQNYYEHVKEIGATAAEPNNSSGSSNQRNPTTCSLSSSSATTASSHSQLKSPTPSSLSSSSSNSAAIIETKCSTIPLRNSLAKRAAYRTGKSTQQPLQQQQQQHYDPSNNLPRRQQQQQHLMQEHQRQQQQLQLEAEKSTEHHRQQRAPANCSGLLWQPWRDLQQATAAAAAAAQLLQQQQQLLHKETRLTTKELPSSKWRRERRFRTVEYHHSAALPNATTAGASTCSASPPGSPPPLPTAGQQQQQQAEPSSSAMALDAHTVALVTTNSARSPLPAHSPSQMSRSMLAGTVPKQQQQQQQLAMINSTGMHVDDDNADMDDSPLDMTVSSSVVKQQQQHHQQQQLQSSTSPPPPSYKEHLLGNHHTYGTLLARPSVITQAPPKSSIVKSNCEPESSVSMCETVIDEHFRRSLGADYVAVFGKRSPTSTSPQLLTAAQQHSPLGNSSNAAPTPPNHALPHTSAALALNHPSAMVLPSGNADQMTSEFERSPPLAANYSKAALAPPQDEPLSLQRSNAAPPLAQPALKHSPNSFANTQIAAESQPLVLTTTTTAKFDVAPAAVSPLQPLPLPPTKFAGAHTPSPPPPYRHSPNAAISTAAAKTTKLNVVSSSTVGGPSADTPAIARVKHQHEPGVGHHHHHHITTANTPPASPTSITSASISTSSSDVLASVDDHFAKALGDTWKKLQQSNELRK